MLDLLGPRANAAGSCRETHLDLLGFTLANPARNCWISLDAQGLMLPGAVGEHLDLLGCSWANPAGGTRVPDLAGRSQAIPEGIIPQPCAHPCPQLRRLGARGDTAAAAAWAGPGAGRPGLAVIPTQPLQLRVLSRAGWDAPSRPIHTSLFLCQLQPPPFQCFFLRQLSLHIPCVAPGRALPTDRPPAASPPCGPPLPFPRECCLPTAGGGHLPGGKRRCHRST